MSTVEELARLGSATVYEGSGREGHVDLDWHRIKPGSRAAGPARTVMCGQDDNLMVHAAMERLQRGEVLVLTMPEPRPVALMGDLLAMQAQVAGAAAVLVNAAIRDRDELAEMDIPIWARWVRVATRTKNTVGQLDVPVVIGGATINPGDMVVLDADGVAVFPAARTDEVLQAAQAREDKEAKKRARLEAGELSWVADELKQQYGE